MPGERGHVDHAPRRRRGRVRRVSKPKVTPWTFTAKVRAQQRAGDVWRRFDAERLDAGVVDEDVHAAELPLCGVEHGRDPHPRGRHRSQRNAKSSGVGPPVGDEHRSAPAFAKTLRNGAPNAGVKPPGDDWVDLLGECEHGVKVIAFGRWSPARRGGHRLARRCGCARRGSGKKAIRAFPDGPRRARLPAARIRSSGAMAVHTSKSSSVKIPPIDLAVFLQQRKIFPKSTTKLRWDGSQQVS